MNRTAFVLGGVLVPVLTGCARPPAQQTLQAALQTALADNQRTALAPLCGEVDDVTASLDTVQNAVWTTRDRLTADLTGTCGYNGPGGTLQEQRVFTLSASATVKGTTLPRLTSLSVVLTDEQTRRHEAAQAHLDLCRRFTATLREAQELLFEQQGRYADEEHLRELGLPTFEQGGETVTEPCGDWMVSLDGRGFTLLAQPRGPLAEQCSLRATPRGGPLEKGACRFVRPGDAAPRAKARLLLCETVLATLGRTAVQTQAADAATTLEATRGTLAEDMEAYSCRSWTIQRENGQPVLTATPKGLWGGHCTLRWTPDRGTVHEGACATGETPPP